MNSTPEPNFSLVLGGPLYQLFLRTHIGTNTLGLLHRRIIIITLFTWLPLLMLSFFTASPVAGAIKVPFIYDVEVHARFLLALPLMIWAELIVHQRINPMISQFVERDIIPAELLPAFQQIIASALRLRNSVVIEVIMTLLTITAGHYVWTHQLALASPTWFALPTATEQRLSPAGFWYAYISIPVFQFILLRWYFRLFIWWRLLWQVARLDLQLLPTHPDRAGGLGFLANSAVAFVPVLLAQGTLLSGMIANRIFYQGATLADFKPELALLTVFLVLMILGPLCVFSPRLMQTKRQGLREYGTLASQYVRAFDRKWLRDPPPVDEPLIGSGDIQSLNDLAGSYEVIKTMRLVPFDKAVVLQTAIVILLPVAPLLLTMISLEEMVKNLLSILL